MKKNVYYQGLPVFKSQVDVLSEDYSDNRRQNLVLVKELNARMGSWNNHGAPHRVAAVQKAGKLLARERLHLLLDEDSPWLEIGPLCGWEQPGWKGNGMLGGVGLVSGIECMVVVNVPTVQSAAMHPVLQAKWDRCSEMSIQNRLPFLQLLESGGADLKHAFEAFHTAPNPFYKLANRSKLKIPSVCVVMGTCIAGGAYMAGMSDYVIMVKGQAQLGLAGSKLVYMATGEVSSDEELGGAEMHSRVSGVSDFLANNEADAIAKAREVCSTFPASKATVFPSQEGPLEEPLYDPEELLGVVSPDTKNAYDCREVMARVVDGSRMSEFKPAFGTTLVCVFGFVHGVPVGIIGNNGVIFSESAQKGTHFINICNQRGTPVIFLHNVTGFMVGQAYEKSGIIKWGSQLVNAVSNCLVPTVTFLIGNSFGAANYALKGHGFEPSFLFSWPNSKCAVMGPDQLSGVLELLAREGAAKKSKNVDEEKLAAQTNMLKARIGREQSAYFTTSRMVDDGIIDPRDTRMVLSMCLSLAANNEWPKTFLEGISRL